MSDSPEIIAPVGKCQLPAPDRQGRMKPGETRNPLGKSHPSVLVSQEIRRILSEGKPSLATKLAYRIVDKAMNPETPDNVAVKYAEIALDRSEGKPVQSNIVLGAQIDESTARELLLIYKELAG